MKTEFFLSGKYDQGSAILSVKSGAGGRDAEDWAFLIFEMYKRFVEKKNWSFRVLSESFGEGGGPEGRIGLKEGVMEIKGKYAYGFLKKETGVHRLVRISPFSSKSLRHTSFCKVDVLPKISKEVEMEIKPEDLKIDTFRSSGKGGQNVNKRETAVRITHLPTGLQSSCQAERYQQRNKEIALNILKAKILQLKEREKEKELEKVKGKKVSVEFGHQIRSYVFHPYSLAKDHRTDIETSQVDDVLNGSLDKFIEKEISL